MHKNIHQSYILNLYSHLVHFGDMNSAKKITKTEIIEVRYSRSKKCPMTTRYPELHGKITKETIWWTTRKRMPTHTITWPCQCAARISCYWKLINLKTHRICFFANQLKGLKTFKSIDYTTASTTCIQVHFLATLQQSLCLAWTNIIDLGSATRIS